MEMNNEAHSGPHDRLDACDLGPEDSNPDIEIDLSQASIPECNSQNEDNAMSQPTLNASQCQDSMESGSVGGTPSELYGELDFLDKVLTDSGVEVALGSAVLTSDVKAAAIAAGCKLSSQDGGKAVKGWGRLLWKARKEAGLDSCSFAKKEPSVEIDDDDFGSIQTDSEIQNAIKEPCEVAQQNDRNLSDPEFSDLPDSIPSTVHLSQSGCLTVNSPSHENVRDDAISRGNDKAGECRVKEPTQATENIQEAQNTEQGLSSADGHGGETGFVGGQVEGLDAQGGGLQIGDGDDVEIANEELVRKFYVGSVMDGQGAFDDAINVGNDEVENGHPGTLKLKETGLKTTLPQEGNRSSQDRTGDGLNDARVDPCEFLRDDVEESRGIGRGDGVSNPLVKCSWPSCDNSGETVVDTAHGDGHAGSGPSSLNCKMLDENTERQPGANMGNSLLPGDGGVCGTGDKDIPETELMNGELDGGMITAPDSDTEIDASCGVFGGYLQQHLTLGKPSGVGKTSRRVSGARPRTQEEKRATDKKLVRARQRQMAGVNAGGYIRGEFANTYSGQGCARTSNRAGGQQGGLGTSNEAQVGGLNGNLVHPHGGGRESRLAMYGGPYGFPNSPDDRLRHSTPQNNQPFFKRTSRLSDLRKNTKASRPPASKAVRSRQKPKKRSQAKSKQKQVDFVALDLSPSTPDRVARPGQFLRPEATSRQLPGDNQQCQRFDCGVNERVELHEENRRFNVSLDADSPGAVYMEDDFDAGYGIEICDMTRKRRLCGDDADRQDGNGKAARYGEQKSPNAGFVETEQTEDGQDATEISSGALNILDDERGGVFVGLKFSVTGFHDNVALRDDVVRKIQQNGGEVVEKLCGGPCEHDPIAMPSELPNAVVADKQATTPQFLVAMCRGLGIVTPKWIYDCLAKEKRLKPSVAHGHVIAKPNPGLRRKTVFEGLRVYIHKKPEHFAKRLACVFKHAGATVMDVPVVERYVESRKQSLDGLVTERCVDVMITREIPQEGGSPLRKDLQCLERQGRSLGIKLKDRNWVIDAILSGELHDISTPKSPLCAEGGHGRANGHNDVSIRRVSIPKFKSGWESSTVDGTETSSAQRESSDRQTTKNECATSQPDSFNPIQPPNFNALPKMTPKGNTSVDVQRTESDILDCGRNEVTWLDACSQNDPESHRTWYTGFKIGDCEVHVADFVELVPAPGETHCRVVRVEQVWSERPVDGQERTLGNCRRFYWPEDVCIPINAGTDEVLSTDHREERVPLSTVVRKCHVIQSGTENQLGGAHRGLHIYKCRFHYFHMQGTVGHTKLWKTDGQE